MSTRQITAITTALHCARGRLQITAAGLAVAVLAAGCGSSSSTTTNTSAAKSTTRTSAASAPAGWTGMGSALATFATAHRPVTDPAACPQSGCYGNSIAPPYVGAGQCCEFVELSTTGPPDNRVDGYTQGFPEGTSIAVARGLVRLLMPNDTTTTGFVIRRDPSGHTCAIWNVRSPTLGKWFSSKTIGDPQGVMRIDLNTLNTQKVFSTNNVTQAVLSARADDHSTNC